MNFDHSDRTRKLIDALKVFMDKEIYPNVELFRSQEEEGGQWSIPPILEELKAKAKAAGLWNLFMPPWHGAEHVDETFEFECPGLTNLEYAPLAEMMGRVIWAPEVFNCSAPE